MVSGRERSAPHRPAGSRGLSSRLAGPGVQYTGFPLCHVQLGLISLLGLLPPRWLRGRGGPEDESVDRESRIPRRGGNNEYPPGADGRFRGEDPRAATGCGQGGVAVAQRRGDPGPHRHYPLGCETLCRTARRTGDPRDDRLPGSNSARGVARRGKRRRDASLVRLERGRQSKGRESDSRTDHASGRGRNSPDFGVRGSGLCGNDAARNARR